MTRRSRNKGGSVHVTAVAEGLAALGHEVHALVTSGRRVACGPGAVDRAAAAARAERTAVGRRARGAAARGRSLPDVIMERYYNFGGEGIGAAARVGATAVLEVNAPVD